MDKKDMLKYGQAGVEAVVESIIEKFPVISTVLKLRDKISAIKQSEFEELFFGAFKFFRKDVEKNLEDILEAIQQNDRNINYLNQAFESLKREYDERKIPLYAQITYNAICLKDNDISIDDRVYAVRLLEELTFDDYNILYPFRDGKTYQVAQIAKNIRVDSSELIIHFCKLEARGLLGETDYKGHGIHAMAATSNYKEVWKHRCYEILPYGEKLIKLIGEPRADQ